MGKKRKSYSTMKMEENLSSKSFLWYNKKQKIDEVTECNQYYFPQEVLNCIIMD